MVPTICLFEVFKRFLIQYSPKDALDVVTVMQRGQVIDVNADVALKAAGLSVELQLPMADSIILATARTHNAMLWTQDTDFKDLPEVRFRQRGAQPRRLNAAPRLFHILCPRLRRLGAQAGHFGSQQLDL